MKRPAFAANRSIRRLTSAAALLLFASALNAQAVQKNGVLPAGERSPEPASVNVDSLAVVEIIQRFHRALEAGDSATALELLREDATILESGGVETKEEYRSHHLASDIAFAQAVRRDDGPVRVVVRGDVAWATSTSTMRGTFRDRPVNSQSVELMVLQHGEDGWRIAAIHWSSRTVRD